MRKVISVFTHVNLQKKKVDSLGDWGKPLNHNETLSAKPYKVKSYDELVRTIAQIAHYNRRYSLFFRGQPKDYLDENKMTTILPRIYRKHENENSVPLKKRFDELEKNSKALLEALNNRKKTLTGTKLLNKYQELQWALLQHYEVCDTPFLDITHSLHVASSFAYDKNINDTGIVYVFGLPYPTDSISYNTFEELLNIKLAGFCPPQAQRPFFQEGYLVGPFPLFELDKSTKKNQFDFAKRLIAKFEIPTKAKFWGDGFNRIPANKLYQERDIMKNICDKISNSNK